MNNNEEQVMSVSPTILSRIPPIWSCIRHNVVYIAFKLSFIIMIFTQIQIIQWTFNFTFRCTCNMVIFFCNFSTFTYLHLHIQSNPVEFCEYFVALNITVKKKMGLGLRIAHRGIFLGLSFWLLSCT